MTEQELIRRLRSERPIPSAGFEARQRKLLRDLTEKEENPVMKRKMSAALVFALVLALLSVTALAASLVFSRSYEAVRVANTAMKEQYGITDDLLSLFHREVKEVGDSKAIITYKAPGDGFPTDRMGDYTVTVDGGKALVTWSNDGKDTSGGLNAQAYGPKQLHEISYNYSAAMQAMREAGILNSTGTGGQAAMTEEDIKDYEARRAAEKEQVMGQARISLEKAAALALDAICDEYGLSDAQRAKISFEADETLYFMEDGKPTVHLKYWLWQKPAAESVENWSYGDDFTEKDGQYWVIVNMENSVIEDILYDSGLAGNG